MDESFRFCQKILKFVQNFKKIRALFKISTFGVKLPPNFGLLYPLDPPQKKAQQTFGFFAKRIKFLDFVKKLALYAKFKK